jgi:hypothetical protein
MGNVSRKFRLFEETTERNAENWTRVFIVRNEEALPTGGFSAAARIGSESVSSRSTSVFGFLPRTSVHNKSKGGDFF